MSEQTGITPLVPTFIQNPVEEMLGINAEDVPVVVSTTPLNPTWWADAPTARALAMRYGANAVTMPPYYPAQWRRVWFNPSSQWYLSFPDGTLINAGILADYFKRNPEQQFPGVADKFVREYIAAAQAGL